MIGRQLGLHREQHIQAKLVHREMQQSWGWRYH